MPTRYEDCEIPFQTRSGVWLDILHPRPEDIRLEDVAYGQSNITRFNGQTPYPLACHSVWVSREVPAELAVPALFHDGHEFITGDVTTPMKRALMNTLQRWGWHGPSPLAHIQESWDEAFATRFGFDRAALSDSRLKDADARACRCEAEAFFPSASVGYGEMPPGNRLPYLWWPHTACRMFLERAAELGVK